MKSSDWLKIISIVIAVIFWVHLKLMEIQTITLSLPVEFINLPQNLVILEDTEDIPVTLEGKGKDLVWLKIFKPSIEVDAANYKYWNNLLKLQFSNIKLPENSQIKPVSINVSKNIVIKTDHIVTVEKPISLSYASDNDKTFFSQRKAKLSNSYVRVNGPESLIEDVKFIGTIPLTKELVGNKDTFTTTLVSPDASITLLSKEIKIQFIKKELFKKTISLIPIECPENTDFAISPDKITIIIEARDEILDSITSKDIIVKLENNDEDFAGLKISVPAGVKIIEYTPEKVQIIRDTKH